MAQHCCTSHTSQSSERLAHITAEHSLARKIRSGFRMIFGIPDYERYLDYCHAFPPEGETEPLSEKAFFEKALYERYGSGKTTRCC
ncbi:CstA-like transporter-associated (seleno)protein [Aneurinibacillus tyrosinisolvens]|uniref:CstA-like transporter-associated (seleno)protein n=1 Tax=Aneurinibacillus tyrosinisolvens TaxID=1443435 RepID=UPI00063FBDB0|nr:YbdD/YjiX family protein [Aneurinibacillus tyrosinisolvens]